MARMQFTKNTRYELDHCTYLIQGELPQGKLLVENLTMGREEHPDTDDLTNLWAQEKLVFLPQGRGTHGGSTTSAVPRVKKSDFDGLPEEYRPVVLRRWTLIQPLLKLPPAKRTRVAIEAHAAKLAHEHHARPRHKRARIGEATSRGSLERWLRDFEESGYEVRALVPRCGERKDKGKSNLPVELESCIQEVLQKCKQSPAHRRVEDVHAMVVVKVNQLNRFRPPDEQLKLPSMSTVERRIDTSGGADLILRRRRSRREAQATQPYGQGPRPTRILERVEIDYTKLDLFVVDDEDRFPIGRPTLTYALDVYSGFPLGVYVGFEPHSYRSVMNCLLHSILPKVDTCKEYGKKHPWLAYGLAEMLVVDNDRPFVNHHIIDACAELGIIHEQMPIETPWFKASIERFFRTNNTGLIHGLPGSTFSNIMMRGDYKARECACISLKEFVRLLHMFLLDHYAVTKHADLGIVPADRCNESVQAGFRPPLHTSVEATRIILYCSAMRKVNRNGIDFEGLRYQSADLQRVNRLIAEADKEAEQQRKQSEGGEETGQQREQSEEDDDEAASRVLQNGTKIRIKYDPGNIHQIYVWDPAQNKPIAIPAVDPVGYTEGLSLWKHRIIRKNALQRYGKADIDDMAETLERIREVVEEAFKKTRSTRTRSTAARFKEIGTGPLPLPATIPNPVPTLDTNPASSPDARMVPEQAPINVAAAVEEVTTGQCTPDQPRETAVAATDHRSKTAPRARKPKVPSVPAVSAPEPVPLDLSQWDAAYDLLPA